MAQEYKLIIVHDRVNGVFPYNELTDKLRLLASPGKSLNILQSEVIITYRAEPAEAIQAAFDIGRVVQQLLINQ